MSEIAAHYGLDSLSGYRFRFGLKWDKPNCYARIVRATINWHGGVDKIKETVPHIDEAKIGELCWTEWREPCEIDDSRLGEYSEWCFREPHEGWKRKK